MGIDVLIEDPRWSDTGLSDLAERASDAVLRHLNLDPANYEIACLACDDTQIAKLNADFRGKPQPTNVLSWPAVDNPSVETAAMHGPELGDIAISYETCAREAEEADRSLQDHCTHLVVHAVLHLLGYDHIDDQDADLMEGIEVEILATLGVPNPY